MLVLRKRTGYPEFDRREFYFNRQRFEISSRRERYLVEASTVAVPHWLTGFCCPHSRHRVWANCIPQCGHFAQFSNVSKACPHCPHFQYSPTGGAALQLGHANPSRRGSLAMRNSARACCKPPQQFISINTARAPYQTDPCQIAKPKNPITPTKPKIVATIRLRPRPSTNHSSARRICPPSSG